IDSSRYIVRGSYGSMGVAGLANRAASASRLIRRDPSRPWPLSWWRKELQQALQLQALQLSSRRRQVTTATAIGVTAITIVPTTGRLSAASSSVRSGTARSL